MNDHTWYKGVPASSTVLVLGEVFSDKAPTTVALQFGQEAYETYQTRVYLEALLMTRHHPTYVDWSPLFVAVYAGILASGAEHVLELGSTLFATADKLDKIRRLSHGPELGAVRYLGVEPSLLFRQIAEALHPAVVIQHVDDVGLVPAFSGRSVSRCYQSSSYAFGTTTAFVDFCALSYFGSHGIWFSRDGVQRVVSILGKPLTLFSLPEFLAGMQARGFTVEFVQKSPSAYAGEVEFFETWLVYHRFTASELATFHRWLDVFKTATADDAGLHPTFEGAPTGERADTSIPGMGERILDFTNSHNLEKYARWRASLQAR